MRSAAKHRSPGKNSLDPLLALKMRAVARYLGDLLGGENPAHEDEGGPVIWVGVTLAQFLH
jgi:hypothetical protein